MILRLKWLSRLTFIAINDIFKKKIIRGFSIIEILAAITIPLVLPVILQTIFSSGTSFAGPEIKIQLQKEGPAVIGQISTDIEQAVVIFAKGKPLADFQHLFMADADSKLTFTAKDGLDHNALAFMKYEGKTIIAGKAADRYKFITYYLKPPDYVGRNVTAKTGLHPIIRFESTQTYINPVSLTIAEQAFAQKSGLFLWSPPAKAEKKVIFPEPLTVSSTKLAVNAVPGNINIKGKFTPTGGGLIFLYEGNSLKLTAIFATLNQERMESLELTSEVALKKITVF